MSPSIERFALTVLIFSGIVIGVIWYGIKPLAGSVQKETNQLQLSYQELNTARQKQTLLAKLASTMSEVNNAKNDADQAIPVTPDADRLTLILQQLATNDHLTIQNLQVGQQSSATTINNQSAATGLATLPFEIDATGSYSNLQALTNDVENNLRIMSITDYSMKTSLGATGNNLGITIQGTAYYQNSKTQAQQ